MRTTIEHRGIRQVLRSDGRTPSAILGRRQGTARAAHYARPALGILVSSVLLLLGSAHDASAQQPPAQIELVSVEHQPSGRVIAAVRSQPPAALDPAQLI